MDPRLYNYENGEIDLPDYSQDLSLDSFKPVDLTMGFDTTTGRKSLLYTGTPLNSYFAQFYIFDKHKDKICFPRYQNFGDFKLTWGCQLSTRVVSQALNLNVPDSGEYYDPLSWWSLSESKYINPSDVFEYREKLEQLYNEGNLPVFWLLEDPPIEEMKHLLQTCQKRFIAIPFDHKSCFAVGHANYLIYDRKENIVERFQPHSLEELDFINYNYHRTDDAIKEFFTLVLGNNSFKYIRSIDICPVGIQTMFENIDPDVVEAFDNPNGYCQIWSLWYLDLRLTYPDVNSQDIYITAVAYRNHKMRMYLFIRNYIEFLIEKKKTILIKIIPDIMREDTQLAENLINYIDLLIENKDNLSLEERSDTLIFFERMISRSTEVISKYIYKYLNEELN